MSLSVIAVILVLLHLLVCFLLWEISRTGVLQVKGYYLPFMLLVPIWGPLSVVILYGRNAAFGEKRKIPGIEKLRINEELHRNILVESRENDYAAVPLEEALLVNDAAEKRKLILSILTENPVPYYELLQQARMNEDSEVVHYAATAMAKISKEADLELQRQEAAYAAAPDDEKTLEEYSNFLEKYIRSGMVQGRAAKMQQRQLVQLLKKRLAGGINLSIGCRLAEAQMAIGEADEAENTLQTLIERWPQREGPWLLRLRSAADREDGKAVQKVLQQIEENHVYLSTTGREVIRFWKPNEGSAAEIETP